MLQLFEIAKYNHHTIEVFYSIHIQIPSTSYVGLIIGSTGVATASWVHLWGYYEGTLMLLWLEQQ